MKKQGLSILLVLCMAFTLLIPVHAAQEDDVLQDGNYRYTVNNGEATIVGYVEAPVGSVVLPSSIGGYDVTAIGADAFYKCKELTSVTVPVGVKRILDRAFAECPLLSEVILPEGLEYLGGSVLCLCTNVQSLMLPSTLREMEANCLSNAQGLTSIEIPEIIKELPDGCFENCIALSSVKLPSELLKIGNNCFYGCSSLEEVIIPDSVTQLGAFSFSFCKSLVHIHLSKAITKLERGLFSGCKSLDVMILPDTITEIESGVFSDCTSLISIHLPKNLQVICDSLFNGCSSLKKVDMPQVVSVEDDAFNSCTALETIVLPDSITSLGSRAFMDCSALKYLRVPVKVTELPNGVFRNCTSLELVDMPAGIQTIAPRAFDGCKALKGIEYPGTEAQLDQIQISDDHNDPLFNCTFYLTGGLYPDAYYGFYDMPDEKEWSYEGISFCLDYGFMNGMGDGFFQPNGTTTRAQLVTILWRMCDEPAAEKAADFKDTQNHWAKDAISWAAENGIVNGVGEGRFAPDAPITREQLVTIFHRFCKEYLEMDVSQTQALDTFPDAGSVSDWAQDAMQWGVGVKLISGVATKDGAILQPQGSATRAQIAKVILNFFENVYTE